MKTYLAIAFLMFIFSNKPETLPTSKLQTLFNATFPEAKSAIWNKTENGYSVFFQINGIQTHLMYDSEERFVEQKRYYTESYLPAYIVMAVKKKYPDKKIMDVTEVTTSSSLFYQLHLNDTKFLYLVNVSLDGSLNLKKKLMFQNNE